MLCINTNLPSLICRNGLTNSTFILNQSVERLTTGFKINGAKDNAANFSITTNMSTKIGAYEIAESNASMGLNLVTTAGESLDLINDKLVRLRALAEQAANGTYGGQSLKAINAEANALIDEIERAYANTEYNGINLFGKSEQVINFIAPVERLSEQQALAEGYTVIKTADELQNIDPDGNYILANDIDLSGYDWRSIATFNGELNGNGYQIKNLTSSTGGLFEVLEADCVVKNVGIANAAIDFYGSSSIEVGILANLAYGGSINNCYVEGEVISINEYVYVGGLLGVFAGTEDVDTITNCYADINIITDKAYCAAGLIGSLANMSMATSNPIIDNCYATGTISGEAVSMLSGLISSSDTMCNADISNCYADCDIISTDLDSPALGYGLFNAVQLDGIHTNCYWNSDKNGADGYSGLSGTYTNIQGVNSEQLKDLIAQNKLPQAKIYEISSGGGSLAFQVGINGSENAQINFLTALNIDNIDALRKIGLESIDFSAIDNLINNVAAKQTEYGAVQNRLESVLEEISVQYENLVSSRSTLRDADIAKVSSEYIRNQILQEASATLLSTANQTPALALQLL